MRCMSAARAKSLAKGKKIRGAPLQACPREGTKLRARWDFLQANRGLPVPMTGGHVEISNDVRAFNDFYGLDVRRVGRRNRLSNEPEIWVLAGEWFGRIYVDYIAERLEVEKLQ